MKHCRPRFAVTTFLSALLMAAGAWGILGSDDWLPGDAASFQAGFPVGEAAAVRMVPTGSCKPLQS